MNIEEIKINPNTSDFRSSFIGLIYAVFLYTALPLLPFVTISPQKNVEFKRFIGFSVKKVVYHLSSNYVACCDLWGSWNDIYWRGLTRASRLANATYWWSVYLCGRSSFDDYVYPKQRQLGISSLPTGYEGINLI
jgi:hypothetical protein